jgi:general stress protein 26
MSDEIVGEAFGSLGQETVSYVATCDGGQPHVRPMMLIYVDGVFYYATGTSDTKVAELMRNPKTEVCVLLGEGDNGGSLRMTGEMGFVYDEDARAKIHGCVGFTQSFWAEPQDPEFTLLEFKPRMLQLMRPGTIEILRADL